MFMLFKFGFGFQFLQLFKLLHATIIRLTDVQKNPNRTIFTYQVDNSGVNTVAIMKNTKGYVETWKPIKTDKPQYFNKNLTYTIEYWGKLQPETYYCLKTDGNDENNYSAVYKTTSDNEIEHVPFVNLISEKMIKANKKHNETNMNSKTTNSNSAGKMLISIFSVIIISIFLV